MKKPLTDQEDSALTSQVDLMTALFAVLIIVFLVLTLAVATLPTQSNDPDYVHHDPDAAQMNLHRLRAIYPVNDYWICTNSQLVRLNQIALSRYFVEATESGMDRFSKRYPSVTVIIRGGESLKQPSAFSLSILIREPLIADELVADELIPPVSAEELQVAIEATGQRPYLFIMKDAISVCSEILALLRVSGIPYRHKILEENNKVSIARHTSLFATESIIR